MPKSFLFTNRRYIPTPPPPDSDDNNNSETKGVDGHCIPSSQTVSPPASVVVMDTRETRQDSRAIAMEVEVVPQALNLVRMDTREAPVLVRMDASDASTHHDEVIMGGSVARVHSVSVRSPETVIHQVSVHQPPGVPVMEEQTEAVDLVVHKARPSPDPATHSNTSYSDNLHRYNTFERRTYVSDLPHNNHTGNYSSVGSNNNGYSYNYASSNNNHLPSSPVYSTNNRDDGYHNSSSNDITSIPTTTNNDNGIDLSIKEYPRYQQPPPAPSEAEMHDKNSLSDGDSDSGCSTQNEARSHIPPEVEYGWAECHAHFSLLYDLMTQSSRKLGKDFPEASPYPNREGAGSGAEQAPYDYSKTSGRSESQEAPVMYELMTESPRKASGRDVPDHALEVEIPMQQYGHHSAPRTGQRDGQPHYQYVDDRRGVVHVEPSPERVPVPRYEARRSLNDLLYAAGLPPTSPPTPTSLSPSSPGSAEGENHTCEDCGKRYSTSSNLARHRQTHRSHGDKKARKCPHCDKVYVSMPAFSMHVRTHNQGCACPHCGKRFSRPWLLQGHIRTHTGEKPFACSQCGKSFADKSNLRAHIQTHSTEKPYVCGRCGKAFALKSYLYKHEESSCMRGERFRPVRKVSNSC